LLDIGHGIHDYVQSSSVVALHSLPGNGCSQEQFLLVSSSCVPCCHAAAHACHVCHAACCSTTCSMAYLLTPAVAA
jgi:hypothetical protein